MGAGLIRLTIVKNTKGGAVLDYQSNGRIIVYSNVQKRYTDIDGIRYYWRKEMTGRNCVTIKSKVYIDGFEIKDGHWKRTLRAMWHCIFN